MYDAAGQLDDLALAYLNPAAQRLLGLPARPATTCRQQFSAAPDGGWAFHRDAFLAGHPATAQLPYPVGGTCRCLRVQGRRTGGALLVSLAESATPAAGQPGTTTPQQLRAYDAVLAGLQEFVYLFDLDGRFRYVNQPLLDLWGLRLDQAVGKTFAELGYPEPLARRLQAQLRQVVDTRRPVTGATSYTSPAGVPGDYEYTFVPLLAPTAPWRPWAGAPSRLRSAAGPRKPCAGRTRTRSTSWKALRRVLRPRRRLPLHLRQPARGPALGPRPGRAGRAALLDGVSGRRRQRIVPQALRGAAHGPAGSLRNRFPAARRLDRHHHLPQPRGGLIGVFPRRHRPQANRGRPARERSPTRGGV